MCETADSQRGKKYKQEWMGNMAGTCRLYSCFHSHTYVLAEHTKALIDQMTSKSKDFTKITFEPDLERFGMTELEDDIVALMTKRVYDIAGCLPQVRVYLNKQSLPVRSFADYWYDIHNFFHPSSDLFWG